jgi:hypothetical protein
LHRFLGRHYTGRRRRTKRTRRVSATRSVLVVSNVPRSKPIYRSRRLLLRSWICRSPFSSAFAIPCGRVSPANCGSAAS